MTNPEQQVLDAIDELVEWSLEGGRRSGEYDDHVNLQPEEPWTYTGPIYDDFARSEHAQLGPDWQLPAEPPHGFPIFRPTPDGPAGRLWMIQIVMSGVAYRVDGVRIAEGDVIAIARDGDGPAVVQVQHGHEERAYVMEVVENDTPE